MQIVRAYPPNIAKIAAAFPQATTYKHVFFCYGDTIFNPSGAGISEALLAHEAVHSERQGDNPDLWWDRYIADPEFRLAEELAAHVEEYIVHTRGYSRPMRRRVLTDIAEKLADPIYGSLVSIEKAKKLIQEAAIDRRCEELDRQPKAAVCV